MSDESRVYLTAEPLDLYVARGIAPGTVVDVQNSVGWSNVGIKAGATAATDKEHYNHMQPSDWHQYVGDTLMAFSHGGVDGAYVIVNEAPAL